MQVIRLELSRKHGTEDHFVFRFEPQEYTAHHIHGTAATAHFAWTSALMADLEALRGYRPPDAAIERIGAILRTFLLPAGWERHEEAIATALARGEHVCVTFRFAAAELFVLPWELCAHRASGLRLGQLANVLVRYEWPDTETADEHPSPRKVGGRILVAWSARGGEVPAGAHIAEISAATARRSAAPSLAPMLSALNDTGDTFGFDPAQDVLEHVTYASLARKLRDSESEGRPFAVVHLLCHGGVRDGRMGLTLNGTSDDSADIVDAERVRTLMARHARHVRLVVLAACDSDNAGSPDHAMGSIAQAVHRGGIQAVVASRSRLSVSGSTRFTGALYHCLYSDMLSLERAFLAARDALHSDADRPDWAAVTLYGRDADGHDTRPVVFRPYRGLLAFGPEHHRFFHGRETEVAELIEKLEQLRRRNRPRLVFLTGASGTGKSSMLLGGVIPELRRRAGSLWEFAYIRAGGDPLPALAKILGALRDPQQPLLLVVDQFEEVFAPDVPANQRDELARRLWTAAGPDSAVHVLVTMRSDFRDATARIALADDFKLDRVVCDRDHEFAVPSLTGEQIQRAIQAPATLVGLEIEAGILQDLRKNAGEPGILPLLEDTLDTLWTRRRGRTLKYNVYEEIGRITGGLNARADSLVERLGEDDQRTTRTLLGQLVTLHEEAVLATRRRRSLVELRPRDPGRHPDQDRVIDLLVRERLLVRGRGDRGVTLEIAHEALIRSWTTLVGWLREDRERNQQIREIEGWIAYHTANATHFSRAQCRTVEQAERRWAGVLTAAIHEFLVKSRRSLFWRTVRNSAFAIVVIVGLIYRPVQDAPCSDSADEMQGVWDDERRAAVEAALRATGVSYADRVVTSVRGRLDGYRQDWIAARDATCEAHRQGYLSTELFDLRRICLRDHRADLAATVEVLSQTTRGTVSRAVQLAASLPPLSLCEDDVRLLDRGSEVPPPDVEIAEEVMRNLTSLARLEVLELTGQHARALSECAPILADAERLAYAPLLTEVLLLTGKLYAQLGRADEAYVSLSRGLYLGLATKLDASAAEALAIRVHVVSSLKHRPMEALGDEQLAWALMQRAGNPPELVAGLHRALGGAYAELGELERSTAEYERGLAIAAAHAPVSPMRLALSHDLATALINSYQPERAGDLAREALHLSENLYGRCHPQAMALRILLADIDATHRSITEAVAGLDPILECTEHPLYLVEALATRARMHLLAGDRGRAEAALARADDVSRDSPESAAGRLLVILTRADLHAAAGESAEARRLLEAGYPPLVEVYGADHYNLASVWIRQAVLALGEGDRERAEQHFAAATRLFKSALPARERGLFYATAARLLRARDAPEDEVIARIAEAEAAYRAAGPSYAARVAELQAWQTAGPADALTKRPSPITGTPPPR